MLGQCYFCLLVLNDVVSTSFFQNKVLYSYIIWTYDLSFYTMYISK